MLDAGLIQAANTDTGRIFSVLELYRFYMDRDDIADNLQKRWSGNAGDPLEVSINLVKLAEEVFQQAIVENEEEEEEEDGQDSDEGEEEADEGVIDVEAALKSTEYKKYINAVAELEKVEILSIKEHEKVAFFLNIYQCMYIHHFLKKIFEEGPLNEESSPDSGGMSSGFGFLGSIKQYVFAYSPKPFYYNIGGIQFNLEEIKHGLLRANVKAP